MSYKLVLLPPDIGQDWPSKIRLAVLSRCPPDHPLWTMPGVLLTPHVAILGAPYQPKREAILLENCRRFASGQPLLSVVDKANWF